ncbi:UNVERIFIED_ORG: hypothetical protein GGE11_003160 [Mycolicibacterium obuense]
MYLSAERVAVANNAIQRTFEQTCIAWQAIPQWDTGDPGAVEVRNDVVDGPGYLTLGHAEEPFELTLAQIGAPTPDAVLTEVIAATAKVAAKVDKAVIDELKAANVAANVELTATTATVLQSALIDARVKLEDNGFRAPSCLLTNTVGLKAISALNNGYSLLELLLESANINSLHRVSQLDAGDKIKMVLLGRRQRIAHGGAVDASPGEEPVDIAVSMPPCLEIVGEVDDAKVRVGVRVRFATRVKDKNGIAGIVDEAP